MCVIVSLFDTLNTSTATAQVQLAKVACELIIFPVILVPHNLWFILSILYVTAQRLVQQFCGSAKASPKAAEKLFKLQIADGFIPELVKMDKSELLKHMYLNFQKIEGFQEGMPLDPRKTK